MSQKETYLKFSQDDENAKPILVMAKKKCFYTEDEFRTCHF